MTRSAYEIFKADEKVGQSSGRGGGLCETSKSFDRVDLHLERHCSRLLWEWDCDWESVTWEARACSCRMGQTPSVGEPYPPLCVNPSLPVEHSEK